MREAAEMSVGRNSVVLAVMVGVTLCTLQMLRPKAHMHTTVHSLQPEVNDTWEVPQPIPLKGWVGARLVARRGNQLFVMASSYGIAQGRGARWCIQNLEESLLENLVIFNTTPLACPSDVHFTEVSEEGRFQHYAQHMLLDSHENVMVGTYLQSFKYFAESGLPFRLAKAGWAQQWVQSRHIQVGIHIRRGDMLQPGNTNEATIQYFVNAIQRLHIMTHQAAFNYVICTDDITWVQQQQLFQGMTVTEGTSPDEDMSILAACEHIIMSVGTFGWWANYLKLQSEGYSLYLDKPFNTEASAVAAAGFDPADHFPHRWVPISVHKEIYISLVVPFRERDQHRLHFLQHWHKQHTGDFTMLVYFVRQANNAPFNRARLFNIGLKVAMNHSTCVIVHDIDMLADRKVNYADCATPIQLSSEVEHWGHSVPYPTYTGGVVSATPAHWRQINGMSNNFVGWGGEDDELYYRLKHHHLLDASTGVVRRPAKGGGTFHALNDEYHTERKRSSLYNDMVRLIERTSRGEVDFATDGLSTNVDAGTVDRMQKLSDKLFTADITVTWN